MLERIGSLYIGCVGFEHMGYLLVVEVVMILGLELGWKDLRWDGLVLGLLELVYELDELL